MRNTVLTLEVASLLILHVCGPQQCCALVRAAGQQSSQIDDSDFATVSSADAMASLLRETVSQQVSAVERVRSWRGEGTLEAWFVTDKFVTGQSPADQGASSQDPDDALGSVSGPFEVHRTSRLSFVWSGELRSLRSSVASVSPTTFVACRDVSVRYDLSADLAISSIVRPDGFYRMFPNQMYGEFDGLPVSLFGGQHTRVVERMPTDTALELRHSTDVFDPMSMLEIGGSPVDRLCARYLEVLASETLARRFRLRRRADGSLVTVMSYVDSVGGVDAEPDLTLEILFDASTAFLPKRAFFVSRGGRVIQSLAWGYAADDGVLVPTRFEHEKFDQAGARVQKRAVNIGTFKVNGRVSEGDFELSQMGLRDGDRLVDRIENNVLFMKGGRPVPIREPSPGRLRRWLVYVNIVAVVVLLGIFFASRFGRPQRTEHS